MKNRRMPGTGVLRHALAQLLAVALVFAGIPVKPIFAQQSNQDFEAPLIEHAEIPAGELGETQVISANVIDNVELVEVLLFYRFAGEQEFTRLEMQQIATSSYYFAKIETTQLTGDESAIEYYLQAEDAAGNTVWKGYIFDPLVRSLTRQAGAGSAQPGSVPVPAPEPEPQAEPQLEQPKSEKKSNTLYYVLGALGLIALAGLAGGSGGSGGSQSGCASAGCQVTLTVTPP